ncbi:amidohydrolase 3, partial [Collybia nuda]
MAFISQRGGGVLLTSYALCSRTGKGVYTVNAKNTQQQCLVVHEEHIVDTGDLGDIQQRWKSEHDNTELPVRFIDSGSIVIPGMSDSHCHILEYGASKLIDLESGKSVQETVGYVAEYILANPDIRNNMSKVIEGWGFDHTAWASGVLPVAADLDAHPITRGRPIILQGKDGHTIWVSPSILRANGPYPSEVDGGVVIRDATGNPTGVFMDSAMDLIARPVLSAEDLEKRFAVTVKEALSKGVVSLHDAGFKPVSLDFFKRKSAINGLPLRIYGMTYFDEDGAYWGDKSRPLIGTGNNRLTARSVKIFADGALRSGGAALYEPYSDNPSTSGLMRITPELLNEVVPKFLRDGWQVNIHAIGDRANGIVLDAFEVAAKKFKLDVASKRPRIEHVQIVTKNDMKRLAKLGVIASVQPSHATDDMWYAEGRLGPERVKNLYAFRNIMNSGARIT